MPSCSLPFFERYFLPTAGGALLLAIVAGMIGHSILRTFLEARGVEPWGVLDSLNAMPLVLLGAAAVGAAATLTATAIILPCTDYGESTFPITASVVLVVSGLLMLRLGLLAVRRLT